MKKSTMNGIVWIIVGIAIFVACSIIQAFGDSNMFSNNYYSTGNEILDLLIEIVFVPGWIVTIGCIGTGVIRLFAGLSSSGSSQVPPSTNPTNPSDPLSQMAPGQQPFPPQTPFDQQSYPSSRATFDQQPYPSQVAPSIAPDQFDPSQAMGQTASSTAVQPQPYAPQQAQPYTSQQLQPQPYAPQQAQPQPYAPQQTQPGMPPAAFQPQPYAPQPQQPSLSLTPYAKRCAGALISAAAISVILDFVQNLLLYSLSGLFYYPLLILHWLAPAVLLFTAITIALTAQKLPKTELLSNGPLLYAIALGAAGIYYLMQAYGSLASFRYAWLGTAFGGTLGTLGFLLRIVLLLLVVAALYRAHTQMKTQGIGKHSLFGLSAGVGAVQLIWLLFASFATGPLFNVIYSIGAYPIVPFVSFLMNLFGAILFLAFFILQAVILHPRPLGR
jgi:hypothetical protein